jgi:hypothetical protein
MGPFSCSVHDTTLPYASPLFTLGLSLFARQGFDAPKLPKVTLTIRTVAQNSLAGHESSGRLALGIVKLILRDLDAED